MKGRILNILRAESGIVSGETISSVLGISRVSIWKHIHKLLEAGYDIRSAPTGYQLVNSPDVLYPWEFPEREKNIHYYAEVSSTMDIARDLARKGCPSFTVVIGGSQTKGRGRLKRSWLSDEGGLYFTVVTRPDIPLKSCSRRLSCSSRAPRSFWCSRSMDRSMDSRGQGFEAYTPAWRWRRADSKSRSRWAWSSLRKARRNFCQRCFSASHT